MEVLKQKFTVDFSYPVYFTEHIFEKDNPLLSDILSGFGADATNKLLLVVDQGVAKHHPDLLNEVGTYFTQTKNLPKLCPNIIYIAGGEQCKNDEKFVKLILDEIDRNGVDRQSYVMAIGGGAILDLVGYAAAIAHRGIRHIRVPTTVLSQNDSGVGVKNGINYFGKKNFLGTFSPPVAVINDYVFLKTLSNRDWRAGIAEAIKVALIKDAAFFGFLEDNAAAFAARDMQAMKKLIYRCAELHLEHISSGDPFEKGSSRPLDFGHWAAHKLEQMSDYNLRHGEAVCIGMALDVVYSTLKGHLSQQEGARILSLMKLLGFRIYDSLLMNNLDAANRSKSVIAGLREFREHLGGKLTIMLLNRIGSGMEVHEMDEDTLLKAITFLSQASIQTQPNVSC